MEQGGRRLPVEGEVRHRVSEGGAAQQHGAAEAPEDEEVEVLQDVREAVEAQRGGAVEVRPVVEVAAPPGPEAELEVKEAQGTEAEREAAERQRLAEEEPEVPEAEEQKLHSLPRPLRRPGPSALPRRTSYQS